jgi:xylan 1,4-beta-xylosidase
VSEAVEKIKEKKMNMTEISISCGFGTIRNFNRVFKLLTGYTPKSLPDNYSNIYNFKDTDEKSFDPTLNCTEILY